MPFQIIHQDITRMKTDAIVNAANTRLLEGGGVCGAIFAAAGSKALQAECDKKSPCQVGQAVLTKGYGLNAKYIIHAVGPMWQGGKNHEEELLRSAYSHALQIADQAGCGSIAFPLISAGIYGYPKQEALNVAVETIKAFLLDHEMMVYLVVFDRKAVVLSEQLTKGICHYIDTYYEEQEMDLRRRKEKLLGSKEPRILSEEENTMAGALCEEMVCQTPLKKVTDEQSTHSLQDLVERLDESFSDYLLKLIDEKGTTDVAVYKKANMDRKLFSKIRSQKAYHPKKQTVISLAIALELDSEETRLLLQKAGYSLSNSYKFDVIIRYFLDQKEYDIFKINEALFYYGEPLLGA